MRFFVYQITNLVNGKIYIGKSNHKLKNGSTRWQIHLRIAKGGKEKYGRCFWIIHRAICKYGESNFKYAILKHTKTESEALLFEQEVIAHSRKEGQTIYNVTGGGEGMTGYHHTKKTKRRLSIACRGDNSPRSILSEQNVITIKQLLKEGVTYTKIADQYKVSKSTIAMIAQGKRWSHIIV